MVEFAVAILVLPRVTFTEPEVGLPAAPGSGG
jgi:hypothetical protein